MRISTLAFVSSWVLLLGCGGGGTIVPMGSDGPVTADQASVSDGGADGSGMVTLKLENYLSWCSVTVNGGTASTLDLQTLTFPVGTVVNLSADKAGSLFEWGYWVGTTGDTTGTHDTTMATTVTMSGDKVVQACCPDATGVNAHKPCPAPN